MKITIDTKEDSPEDIRKAIQILTHCAEQHKPHNIFEEQTTQPVFGNIFGEVEEVKTEPKPKKEKIEIIPY